MMPSYRHKHPDDWTVGDHVRAIRDLADGRLRPEDRPSVTHEPCVPIEIALPRWVASLDAREHRFTPRAAADKPGRRVFLTDRVILRALEILALALLGIALLTR